MKGRHSHADHYQAVGDDGLRVNVAGSDGDTP
jgi:hypothetical protein